MVIVAAISDSDQSGDTAAADEPGETVVSADYQVVGRVGTPGKKVVEYAEEVDARYLVVGGGARSPVGKALFGSETQSILLNANLPVVTVTAHE